MLYAIRSQLLSLLAADARLTQGGDAYNPNPGQPAWPGVKQPDNGDTPTKGYMNVFASTYKKVGENHRPALYVGDKDMMATDRLDFATCNSSGGGRIEYRRLLLPLIIVVEAATEAQAEAQRDQLYGNIEQILLDKRTITQSGYWFELTVPGISGGGQAMVKMWSSTAGGLLTPGAAPIAAPANTSTSSAEAMGRIPVQIRYSRSTTSNA